MTATWKAESNYVKIRKGKKVDYRRPDDLTKEIVKSIIKSEEYEESGRIGNGHHVLVVQHTTRVFNVVCVGGCECDCTPSSSRYDI